MSWASFRKTTRVEDIAYSLLGIFDVHMPLIYGEGHQAFMHLQWAILERRIDLSILFWSPDRWDREKPLPVFAPGPGLFYRI